MYYCEFENFSESGRTFLFIVIGSVLIALWLYMVTTTADNYLAPSLEYLTIKFRINESLAGATLLALANGAADVFSALSANLSSSNRGDGLKNPDDNLLSICLLLGATCFVSSFVQYRIA